MPTSSDQPYPKWVFMQTRLNAKLIVTRRLQNAQELRKLRVSHGHSRADSTWECPGWCSHAMYKRVPMEQGRLAARNLHDPTTESCQHFTPHTERHHRWEWDDAKSHRTKRERGISFDEATAALETDRYAVRIPVGNPSKWENLEGLDYKKEGIERTAPNTDPVRDMYIFKHHGKTWILIATLRGELALVHKRVISVRRAKSKEERLYDNQALSGNAGMQADWRSNG